MVAERGLIMPIDNSESVEESSEMSENRDIDIAKEITKLKQRKTKVKTVFTRVRRALLTEINREIVEVDFGEFDHAQDSALQIMSELQDLYLQQDEIEKANKISEEIDVLEVEYKAVVDKFEQMMLDRQDATRKSANTASRNEKTEVNRPITDQLMLGVQSVSDENVDTPNRDTEEKDGDMAHVKSTSNMIAFQTIAPKSHQHHTSSVELGQDMWKQLQRVSIPTFSGDKRTYENWRAAFYSCVDMAPATAEYKLLQLRQYLSGEALQCIQSLGHSATAYEVAKERLQRKYGGSRRQVAISLEEVEKFRPIREGHPKDVEKFADILDVAVINLKEAGKMDELKDGSLYIKLQRKLPQAMLAAYHRWVCEKQQIESVESLRAFVVQEAEFQVVAAETINGIGENRTPTRPRTMFGGDTAQHIRWECKICSEQHGVWACPQFKEKTIHERWELAKQHKLCYRCLTANHKGQKCQKSRICGIQGCQETHNRLLHQSRHQRHESSSLRNVSDVQESIPQPDRSLVTTTLKTSSNEYLPLRTVPVLLQNGLKQMRVNALLDDASTKTYLNADVATELGIIGEPHQVSVSVVNDRTETFKTNTVNFILKSIDGKISRPVNAWTTTRVTGNMKVIDWRKHANKWKHITSVPFPSIGQRPIVDILIGADQADLHFSYKDLRGGEGEPIARLTPLGWTCIGHPEATPEATNFTAATFFTSLVTDNLLRRFWEIEEVDGRIEQPIAADDQAAITRAEDTLKRNTDRYEVGIPWKEHPSGIKPNYTTAMKRLCNTEKRLIRDKILGEMYDKVITEYDKKGYIRKVSADEENPRNAWYLPHFPICRPDKQTTKLRIVFDASAKEDGQSLNDMIHQGPKLQQSLTDVLLRFRKHPIAIVCDIAEMYLQIQLKPEDRVMHRFIWRHLRKDHKPDVYEFSRLVFGVNCSPFLAQFVAQHHARQNNASYPRAAETVLRSTYMDDSMDSVQDVNEGLKLYTQLVNLWKGAGMRARKWVSNATDIMEKIPIEDRALQVNIEDSPLPTIKTLGITWQAEEDLFTFSGHQPDESFIITKRSFLSKIATVFDPLGFLSPYIIRAKVILQEMWSNGCDWDEKLSTDLELKAISWFKELPHIAAIKIHRCLQPLKISDVQEIRLHTFTDASQDAYAAVVYLVSSTKYHVERRIVASKTKVAPLKAMSIPRLELMGAVLGLRLALSIAAALELETEKLIFWSDSQNVLYWIRGHSRRFKPFIANRVGEVQLRTNPQQWRYVPTKSNPADLASRGVKIKQLAASALWWNGPDFIGQMEESWREIKIEGLSVPASSLEMKRKQTENQKTMYTLIKSAEHEKEKQGKVDRLDPNHYSR